MRRFRIVNCMYDETEGWLSYDGNRFSMTICDCDHPDMFFDILLKQGVVNVPQYLVDMWVRNRVICPERQGLEGMLKAMGMSEYNVFDLLMYFGGRCNMDSTYLEEVF